MLKQPIEGRTLTFNCLKCDTMYNWIYFKRDFFLGLFVGIVVTYLTTLMSIQPQSKKIKSSENTAFMTQNDDRLVHRSKCPTLLWYMFHNLLKVDTILKGKSYAF